ncbi:MAG: hypothetical protein R3C68_14985 [Myxococcota bacterium]
MGARNLLAAFDIDPTLKSQLCGAALFQPAIAVQIAKDFNEDSELSDLLDEFFEVIGGKRESLVSMANPEAFARWPKDLPTVVVASNHPSGPGLFARLSNVGNYLKDRYGVPTDGTVSLASQTSIPGAALVVLNKVDHDDAVTTLFDTADYFAKLVEAGKPAVQLQKWPSVLLR